LIIDDLPVLFGNPAGAMINEKGNIMRVRSIAVVVILIVMSSLLVSTGAEKALIISVLKSAL